VEPPDPEVLAPERDVLPARLVGPWRISSMELWEQEDVDTMGPGRIHLNKDGTGDITFLCVQGRLDCEALERDGRPAVDFTWEGDDDGDRRCGRGWLRLDTDEAIVGRIYFHMGDSSAFRADRATPGAVRAPHKAGKRRRR
jgi:hypothetical protein